MVLEYLSLLEGLVNLELLIVLANLVLPGLLKAPEDLAYLANPVHHLNLCSLLLLGYP